MIKTRLSPCLFRLLSTIVFVDDLERCGSTIGDRSGYADKVVKCWTGCLAVMIENRLAVSLLPITLSFLPVDGQLNILNCAGVVDLLAIRGSVVEAHPKSSSSSRYWFTLLSSSFEA